MRFVNESGSPPLRRGAHATLDHMGNAVVRALAWLFGLVVALSAGAQCLAQTHGPCPPQTAQAAWSESDIRGSRIVHRTGVSAPRPHTVGVRDPVVVSEAGGRSVTILDGRFMPAHRFSVSRELHGAPRLSPDGRFAYLASPDGWVGKYDLGDGALVAEVRAGLGRVEIAVSGDGTHVAVASCEPRTLALLDPDLAPLKVLPVRDREGRRSAAIAAIRDAPPRRSFVVALDDVAELWEISYDPKADDVPIGVIHDFQYREGAFVRGYLNPRRSVLQAPIGDFLFTPDHSELLGAPRGGGRAQVVNLDVRRTIAVPDIPAIGPPGQGGVWTRDGRPVMAVRARADGAIVVVDPQAWRAVRLIPMPGPGGLVRTHDAIPYAWADAAPSGAFVVIDKRTLERVDEVRVAAPGSGPLQLEFSRDGRQALASVGAGLADGGAVAVFETAGLVEVARIPMDRPGLARHAAAEMARQQESDR